MSKPQPNASLNLATLDDELNQMQRDYCDPTLNRYDTGPGADLDDRQQPGALAAAATGTSSVGGDANEMTTAEIPAVKIHLKNTRDLTEAGLRELCRPYGTVISVFKPKQDHGNYAFVEFANQSEAGIAIQELNRKLGFQFYPTFANERQSAPMMDAMHVMAPPPPFEPAPGEKLVQLMELSGDEESWEATLGQRRIKSGFSIPLKIKFPPQVSLTTAAHYAPKLGKLTPLSRVDADQIFSIVLLVDCDQPVSKDITHDKIKSRIDQLVQREAVNRLTLVSEANNKPVYRYTGLSEEQRLLFADTYCKLCGHRGFFSCSICGTQYCSKHCQQKDYDNHRELCQLEDKKSPEKTEKKKASFEDLDDASLTQEVFPKGSHVTILSVLSPERVFVRSLDKESNKEYLQTLNDLAKAGLRAESLTSIPEPGDICLAYYEPRKIYGRVLIIKVNKRQAHCVFIEFGSIKLINVEDLKRLDCNDLKLKKVRVHKIHLKGITEEHGHIEKAMKYLNSLVNQPLEMKVQLEGNNMVDAQLRTAEGISVNKKINHLITIPIVKVLEDIESFIDYKTVSVKLLPPNQELDIVIINRTTIKLDFRVSLIAFDDLPFLEDLQQKLQCYGKKVEKFSEHYTPRLNELCLVRNMDTWYRAVLLETVGDGRPTVYLCDYGCMIMAKLEDIRKIPPSLAVEVRTTDAKIFGLEEANKAGVKIDSEFLDIYLEENERMRVQTSEEIEFKEFEDTLGKDETSTIAVIKVPDLISFIMDRAHCV